MVPWKKEGAETEGVAGVDPFWPFRFELLG